MPYGLFDFFGQLGDFKPLFLMLATAVVVEYGKPFFFIGPACNGAFIFANSRRDFVSIRMQLRVDLAHVNDFIGRRVGPVLRFRVLTTKTKNHRRLSMTDELPPPTIEELNDEMRFVINEMDSARARGIATNVILIETLVLLSENRLIDGKQLCEALTKRLPDLAPESAKIDMAFQINELMIRLKRAKLDA